MSLLDTSTATRAASLCLQNRGLIGLVGFEPTACRVGDRSTISFQAPLYLVRSCNIARALLLRNAWQRFHCGPEPTALHVSSPWIRPRYDGEYAQLDSRKSPRSAARFSDCVARNT